MIRIYYRVLQDTEEFTKGELLTRTEIETFRKSMIIHTKPKLEATCVNTKECYLFFGARFTGSTAVPVKTQLDKLAARGIRLINGPDGKLWLNTKTAQYSDNINRFVRGYGHLNEILKDEVLIKSLISK